MVRKGFIAALNRMLKRSFHLTFRRVSFIALSIAGPFTVNAATCVDLFNTAPAAGALRQIMEHYLPEANKAISASGHLPFDNNQNQIFRGNTDPSLSIKSLIGLMLDSAQPGIQSYSYKRILGEEQIRHPKLSEAIEAADNRSANIIAEEIGQSESVIDWVTAQMRGSAWTRSFDQREALAVPTAFGPRAIHTAITYALRQLKNAKTKKPASVPVVLELDVHHVAGLPWFDREFYIFGRIQPKSIKRIYIGYHQSEATSSPVATDFGWIQMERIDSSIRILLANPSPPSLAAGPQFQRGDLLLEINYQGLKYSPFFNEAVEAYPSLKLLLEEIGI